MAHVNVAINGFGRIGRLVLRALVESGRDDIRVVSINDLGPVETNAHLLRWDSNHGRLASDVWSMATPSMLARDRSRSPPNGTRRNCPMAPMALTLCWNAPGCSRNARTPPSIPPPEPKR